MIDQLLGQKPVGLPPPRFRELKGRPMAVSKARPPRLHPASLSAAQHRGKKFEARVLEGLKEIWPDVEIEQWWSFLDQGLYQVCQTDAVLLHEDLTVVFEVKVQHSIDSWWQLRRLYEPVLREFRPKARVVLVEICKVFDPAIQWPEPFDLIEDLELGVSDAQDRPLVYRWEQDEPKEEKAA